MVKGCTLISPPPSPEVDTRSHFLDERYQNERDIRLKRQSPKFMLDIILIFIEVQNIHIFGYPYSFSNPFHVHFHPILCSYPWNVHFHDHFHVYATWACTLTWYRIWDWSNIGLFRYWNRLKCEYHALPDIKLKDVLVWQHFLPCRLNTLNVIANILINVGAHLGPTSTPHPPPPRFGL